MNRLVIGTRGSDLALAQAEMVCTALRVSGFEGEIDTKIIKTSGDQRTDIRLSEFAKQKVVSQGAFTKELEDALSAGDIDAAVHSAKDLPSRLADGFELASVLERAPVEDVLIARASLSAQFKDLPEGATLATSSVRRECIARWLRPDLQLVDIRGNVPTRLRKLAAGDAGDATILARAGIERLGFYSEGAAALVIDAHRLPCWPLDAGDFVPAGGQGAVGIEVRGDSPAGPVVKAIEHGPTALQVAAERAFLFELGAGCDTPVGVQASAADGDDQMHLTAIVFDESSTGANPARGCVTGSALDPRALACRLLEEMEINQANG